MYHVALLVVLYGPVVVPAQQVPGFQPTEEPPVRLGAPILAPEPDRRRTVAVAGKPDVVLTWNEAALKAIQADRTPPPRATRNLAILHAAMYDAVNSIARTHAPYRFQSTTPDGAMPVVVAAIAAHRTLASLYPKQLAQFDDTLDRCLETFPDGAAKSGSIAVGQAVAEKMLAWRSTDGATRQVAYTPGRFVGQWRPTPPEYRTALLPQWSRVTCFCMSNGEQFRPVGPPSLTSARYAQSLNQVKAWGGTFSAKRTADQTEVAWFWSDGEGTVTPPGHWNRIAQTVARQRSTSLEENARLFALLNLAMADAAILCWDCKYHYSFWRPVAAIRQANLVGNPNTVADPDWTPLLPTPPFPAYTSGHSTFSAAAAAVLAHFFETDEVPFASRSDTLPGVTRTFSRFSAAANEAGLSRIYGGIHYDFDNDVGLATGRALGDYVCQRFLLPQVQAGKAPLNPAFAVRRR